VSQRYSQAFKDRMVERMASAGGPTAVDLSQEVNVPGGTLSRWLREAGSVGDMAKRKRPKPPSTGTSRLDRDPRSTRDWTPTEKLRVVTAAGQLKDEELGEFLRREGIHLAQLEEWRNDILVALGASPPRAGGGSDAKKIRELQQELARKDKALAEVTALLVLRKKLEALFGTDAEEGSSQDRKNEKK
jgi:transposase